MSGTSTGTGPPGPAAATGTSSPPSERSSRSTGSSSASSAARWATSCSRLVRSPKAVLWAAMAAYAAGFGALAALEHRAFETGRFDLGNMTQAVWSTVEGRPLDVTELGGDQISRLGAHVDPLLALFAPLWLVWPSPTMLLVVQAGCDRARGTADVLARPQAPRDGLGRRALRARLPRLPRRAVACTGRVPPGRAGLPPARVRLLVPGRGSPVGVRAVRTCSRR